MSIKYIGLVLRADIPYPRKLTLVAIADRSDDDGYSYPGIAYLSTVIGKCTRAVQQDLQWLESNEVVERHRRRGQDGRQSSNGYLIKEDNLIARQFKVEGDSEQEIPTTETASQTAPKQPLQTAKTQPPKPPVLTLVKPLPEPPQIDHQIESEILRGESTFTPPKTGRGVNPGSPQGCTHVHPRGESWFTPGVNPGSPYPSVYTSSDTSVDTSGRAREATEPFADEESGFCLTEMPAPESENPAPKMTGSSTPDPAPKKTPKRPSKKAGGNWPMPDGLNPVAWEYFEAHRKAIKKPLTDRARTLNANQLLKLPFEQQLQCVELTEMNSWRSVFPDRFLPKTGSGGSRGQKPKYRIGGQNDDLRRKYGFPVDGDNNGIIFDGECINHG